MATTASVLFIATLTTYYYMAESGFNPNPQKMALPSQGICLPARGECPGYHVGNASLRILSLTDIKSQQVSFTLTAEGPVAMARIGVYLDNVSLGIVSGPFVPSKPTLISLGVPTTMSVRAGQSYTLVMDGSYIDSSGAQSDYWQSIDVVAASG